MPYDRPYSLQDVVDILNASEGCPRPDITSGLGEYGHPISLHSQERLDKFARPNKRDGSPAYMPQADTTCMVDRNALAGMVHEALNSPSGQKELQKLNGNAKGVVIRSVVLRQGKDFDIFVVYRPREGTPGGPGGQMSFDWASVVKGDGYIVQVFVSVYKIPNSSEQAIHIQTAYAEDFARTQGDAIVRASARPGQKGYKGGA